MTKKYFISFIICCLSLLFVEAQNIKILTTDNPSSLRGLSVVDDRTIWVSGSNGTIGRSIDSGHTWKWIIVKGFEKADFRDIEAFDETSAVIMGIGDPAYILRTADGGDTWKVVYENKTKGMFLDAMEFWNENSGIVIGDPIDGKFFIARTFNGGITWGDIAFENRPLADSGEACFAASGTNIRKLDRDEACFITGGKKARIFIRDTSYTLPLVQGTESRGAYSVAVKNSKTMIVVGGDYTMPDSSNNNCTITKNGGKTWQQPIVSPKGYKSCIEHIRKNKWICCGLTGVDISLNNGLNWNVISTEGFNVCKKAKNGKAVFLAGDGGKIGVIENY